MIKYECRIIETNEREGFVRESCHSWFDLVYCVQESLLAIDGENMMYTLASIIIESVEGGDQRHAVHQTSKKFQALVDSATAFVNELNEHIKEDYEAGNCSRHD